MSRSQHDLLPYLLALALPALAACDDMLSEASVLDAPRLLAIRAIPATLAPGGPLELEALAWRVDDVTWTACTTAWIPAAPPTCPTGEIALGVGNPLAIIAPDAARLWVLAASPGPSAPLPAIRELRAGATVESPTLLGLDTAAGDPLPARVTPGAELALRARLAGDPTDPPRVVTYYTSAGTFSPFRVFEDAPTTLTSPDAPAEATVLAVVRDPTGGVDWLRLQLTVGDAP